MHRMIVASLVAIVGVSTALAGPKLGSPAPQFSELEAATGEKVSLGTFEDKDILVICITCNHCPVAKAYEDRMIEFVQAHAGKEAKVGFLAVNVNNTEQDRLPAMKERAEEKGFNFLYAYDPSQKIAKDLGATKTPEFFVFDKNRKLIYTGAMDDSAMDPAKVSKQHLVEAVQTALSGSVPTVAQTKPVGCGIRFER